MRKRALSHCTRRWYAGRKYFLFFNLCAVSPLNFAGKFDFSYFDADGLSGSSVDVQANSGGLEGAQHGIVVPDAHLLFAGDYKRAGLDLVLSKDGHDHVVHDYFKGHVRAALS
ncbi:MAG TPA: hypothetical protein VIQ05_20405, partial [Tardiphaga sp.]